MTKPVLGVDIGGVISDRLNDGTGENDPEEFLKAPAVSGAIESIAELARLDFGHENIFLVSKCRWNMQRKTRMWLRAVRFWEMTGLHPDQAWFCLERSEKADICRTLGITHFVDDRLEILSSLDTVRVKVLFRPNAKELRRYALALASVHRVENWRDARDILCTTL